MKYRTVLLFGAPGSGKGTQGKILGTIPNFFHCACGDVFRNLTVNSDLGRTFIDYSSKGELVPDEYTIKLWRKAIEAKIALGEFDPERDTLVLDGLPRNTAQAEMLRDALDVRALCYLICTDFDKLVARLQRRALRENRLDDVNLEVIKTRLATYERDTKPVVDFYGQELVRRVDATQAPIEVLQSIVAVLSKL
ncbi:MAG: nucleoside monophosphate kinase [Pedosphaera parvula]|nr:nucleoside monophosphate kinase [Pedosphaera parvula]